MKILLLKPISDLYYVIQPNFGLGYLASIMIRKGHDVQILDSGKEQLDWKGFVQIIEKGQYDLIGIQMYTHNILSAKEHTRIIKERIPDCTVIIGGAHISGDPEGTMEFIDQADFGFTGEAEAGIEEFLNLQKDDYLKPELLAKIPNLVWKSNGKTVINPRAYIQDLDEIEFPAWHIMAPSSYPNAPHGSFCKRVPVAPMIISRGCPYQCTFCAGRSVTGSRIRYRSVENVLREIDLLYHQYNVREIHIEDDNFTLQRDYVIAFCNELMKMSLDLVLSLPNGIRLDTLDAELLTTMEKAGFYSIAVGIESGSDRVLELMRKKTTVEMIKQKVALIKSCTNMHVSGFFLLGYPGETEPEILQSIELAKSLPIDKVNFLFVMPFPGSDLWEEYIQRHHSVIRWENFLYYRIMPGLSDIPERTLRRLHRKAIRQFYLRPGIILGLAGEIKSFRQLKILIKRITDIFISKPSRSSGST